MSGSMFGIGIVEMIILGVIGLFVIGGLGILLVLAFERKKNKD